MKKTICALTVSAAALDASQAAVLDGLINYWNFDGNLNDANTGASSVADNGTFGGANGTDGIAFGAGLFGQGIVLNGAGGGATGQENDGYVLIPRSADTLFGANATNAGSPNTVTTSMWINAAGFDTGWQTMLSHGEGAQYRIARRSTDNPAAVAYAGGSADIPGFRDGPSIDPGTGWHHVVAISEGGVSTRLWVDGSLIATGGAPVIDDARGGGALDLFIGANPDTGANNREFWGDIDDVAQWNRVLSDTEIGSIWNGGQGSSIGSLIPEPSSALLGLLGLGLIFRRRR